MMVQMPSMGSRDGNGRCTQFGARSTIESSIIKQSRRRFEDGLGGERRERGESAWGWWIQRQVARRENAHAARRARYPVPCLCRWARGVSLDATGGQAPGFGGVDTAAWLRGAWCVEGVRGACPVRGGVANWEHPLPRSESADLGRGQCRCCPSAVPAHGILCVWAAAARPAIQHWPALALRGREAAAVSFCVEI